MQEFRNCVLCGAPFLSNHPRKMFCGAQHAMKAANLRYRNRGKKNIAEQERVLRHIEPEYAEPVLKPVDEGKESFREVLSFLDEASKKEKQE